MDAVAETTEVVKAIKNNDANGLRYELVGGLTKREYMATALTAAIISGAVARGCPSNEWWDAPAEGARLADKLLRVLAK